MSSSHSESRGSHTVSPLTVLRALVRKDLRRQIVAPLAPAIFLLFPLAFAALLALTFGGGDESPQLPKVKLLLEDRDQELVGDLLRSALASRQVAEYFDLREVEEGTGRELMDQGEASALLILPEGLTDALLDGEPTVLEVVRNPSESILPEAAVQSTEVLAAGLDSAARLLAEPLTTIRPLLDDDSEFPEDATIATLAVEVNRLLRRSEKFLMPPVLELESSSGATDQEGLDELAQQLLATEEEIAQEAAPAEEEEEYRSLSNTIFLLILPGVAVFSLFSLGDRMMRDLPREAQLGTLTRQLASPLNPGLLIAGKMAVAAIFLFAVEIILALVAVLLGGARADILGFLILCIALNLAVCGTAAGLYAFARDEAQGSTMASALFLILGFSSGSFLPLDEMPALVKAIAPFTPFYWATEGFKELLFQQASIAQLGTHLAILCTFGLVLTVVASITLKRRILGGNLR
ncbi:MAG: ABC transporter permease [Acidobacteriota bacterium]